MAAGLPGVGLGGIFFVIVALCMPFIELVRMARGHSTGDRWPLIMRQFVLALAIVAAAAVSFAALSAILGSGGDTATAVTPEAGAVRRLRGLTLPMLAAGFGVVLGLPLLQHLILAVRRRRATA